MSLTIKQIAEKLNIGDAAVYYFLKTHPDIEEEYREETKGRFTGGRRPKLYREDINFIIANVKNIQSLDLQSDFEKGKKGIAEALIKSNQNLPSTEQVLLKTVELLNQLQSKLEASNNRIEALERSSQYVSLISKRRITRDQFRKKVSEYCEETKIEHSKIYSKIYGELQFRHRINIMAVANSLGKSGLEIVESKGLLEEINDIFDSMFKRKS